MFVLSAPLSHLAVFSPTTMLQTEVRDHDYDEVQTSRVEFNLEQTREQRRHIDLRYISGIYLVILKGLEPTSSPRRPTDHMSSDQRVAVL